MAGATAAALLASVPALEATQCPDPAGREDAIVRGEVLITLTEFPGSDAKEGCVVGYIPASPDAVMAVLRDAGSYDEYMPRVERSDVSTGSSGELLNRQELELPFPIGDRQFTITLVEERSPDGSRKLIFDYVEGSGNIAETHGHWLVEPWRDGTLATYVLWSDPGGAIPKWAVNRASRRTLPDVVRALRARVVDRREGLRASDDSAPPG
jgi:hypothetical protein